MITKKKEDREAPRKTKIYFRGCYPSVTQRHPDAKSGNLQIIGFLSYLQTIDTDSFYTNPHWPQLNWSVGAFLLVIAKLSNGDSIRESCTMIYQGKDVAWSLHMLFI